MYLMIAAVRRELKVMCIFYIWTYIHIHIIDVTLFRESVCVFVCCFKRTVNNLDKFWIFYTIKQ